MLVGAAQLAQFHFYFCLFETSCSVGYLWGMSQPIILIVEDELLIRLYLSDVLEEAGWTVRTADNAVDAVNDLNGVAAVLSDIDMPGDMNGVDLARLVRRERPDCPVILMSGRILPSAKTLPPGTRFLAKPFPAEALLDAINDLMSL